MPARLHFSNSLDVLADRLIENLSREGGDPLRVPRIATPSAAARDWLKVRLAEKTGIAANIAFPHLEILLWDRLAERDRHRVVPERQPARPLNGDAFQGLVLAQLRAAPPDALRAYLGAREGGPEDAARRLCQLSGRLAALFREYEYNRVAEYGFPGVAESWMRGEPCFEPRARRDGAAGRIGEIRALEGWQMEIYRALFRPGEGLRDRWGAATKIYRYTLPQYAELALGDPETPPPDLTAPVFHLFGLSNVSPFHRDLVGRLADSALLGSGAARFEIYALNPCAEFWEDALSLRERRARGRRALSAAPVPRDRVEATRPDPDERALGALREEGDENGLLALFGKPGRETVKLWCQLTDHDFLEDFREPEAGSLLGAVRASMLHRAGPLETRVPPDASLRLRRARDPRARDRGRARRMLRPPSLGPGLAPRGPRHPGGRSLRDAAPAARPRSPGARPPRATFPHCFRKATRPKKARCCAGCATCWPWAPRRRIAPRCWPCSTTPPRAGPRASKTPRPDAAAAFLESAGFQEGWDGDTDGSTLSAAADRIVWSFALDPADPAAPDAGAWAANALPALDREEAARLLEWLEALRLLTRPLRDGASRPFAQWARLLRELKERFLPPGPSDARADLEIGRFLDDLESWGDWGGDVPHEADVVLLKTLFEDRFRDGEGSGRASFLRGGVRVGGLSALRGLPFRHVWILGLSSEFPATAEAAPLDLRAYRRIPGESDPAARDLYALLETLAATSGTVSISWPAQGLDGGERQPSRALTGLMAWLENDVLPEGARPDFEDMPVPAEASLPAAPRAPVAWASDPERDAARALDWRRLEEFLGNPATHAARRRFRVNAWDALDLEEEERSAALFLDRRDEEALLAPALRAELIAPGSGTPLFRRLWETQRRGGHLPPSPYDALEGRRLADRLAAEIVEEAEALRAGARACGLRFAGTLRLGPQGPERAEPPVLNLPALDASDLGAPVRAGGLFPGFFRGDAPESGWALRVEKGREFPAYLLRLWADAVALPGPLRFLQGPARLFVRDATKKSAVAELREAPSFARETARKILFDLLSDYLGAAAGEGHLDDLSLARIEAVVKDAGQDPAAVGDWTRALEDARAAAEEVQGARVTPRDKVLRAIGPRIPDDAGEAVRRRALPYLAWKRALYGGLGPSDAGGGA